METYKGKRVAVVGLSVEGQDSVKFFAREGARITCCDRRTRKELGSMYDSLSSSGVSFQLGKAYLENLENQDIVVRTQGMALWLPELTRLVAKGIPITSNTKIFFDTCVAPIIGVTGTKGKGTTSTLIFEMLKASGRRAYVGGNVGTPLLSEVRKITSDDWVVLELSSFQLEDLHRSPHIAVVLRITQDHLANYDPRATNYHKSRDAYVAAKKPIVFFQTEKDYVIYNADDPVSSSFALVSKAASYSFRRYGGHADAYVKNHSVYLALNKEEVKLCDAGSMRLRGEHNLENIAAASLASRLAGVPVNILRNVAPTFEGLEHRLEFVRTVYGVSYYNDSFSTVPETAIAAIESFHEPIVLVAGGSEKGSDFTLLGRGIAAANVKALIAIGQMAERIIVAAKHAGYSGPIITGCTSMKEIVLKAQECSSSGDVVLLSPACASFDMFKNYKARGYQFKHEVARL